MRKSRRSRGIPRHHRPAEDQVRRIGGYAAYRYAMPPADFLAQAAARAAYEAEHALVFGAPDAEVLVRRAIELHVDAFLADRVRNAASFRRAHLLGRVVEQRYGCLWRHTTKGDAFVNECGVLALHSRFGLSPAGPTKTACSVCGAGAFACDHVEGEVYGERQCTHVTTEWDLEEISVTPRPRDPRAYRVTFPMSLDEAARHKSAALEPGERPVCSHCRDCYGRAGPTPEDLDPSTWPDLPDDN